MTKLESDSTKARLEAAVAERDAALQRLAAVQAELEALRLRLLSVGESTPPNYPASVTPGDPPLRYVLVDEVHGVVKGVLGRFRLRRRSEGE